MRGVFCVFRVFFVFQQPCLSLFTSAYIAFVFLWGLNAPLLCKFTLAGYINAGSGWPPYAMMGARTRSIFGQRSGQSRSAESLCHAFGLRCAACKDVDVHPKEKG